MRIHLLIAFLATGLMSLLAFTTAAVAMEPTPPEPTGELPEVLTRQTGPAPTQGGGELTYPGPVFRGLQMRIGGLRGVREGTKWCREGDGSGRRNRLDDPAHSTCRLAPGASRRSALGSPAGARLLDLQHQVWPAGLDRERLQSFRSPELELVFPEEREANI